MQFDNKGTMLEQWVVSMSINSEELNRIIVVKLIKLN